MRKSKLILTITTLLIASVSASAQNRTTLPPGEQDKYVVSAKPGIVNLIDGELSSTHAKTGWAALLATRPNDWNTLIVGDEIRMDDTVKAGPDSRAEVLLMPGVYLRVADGAEFVFQFDGATRQSLDLKQGSIILEASVDGWITIHTPKAEVRLIRAGLYRISTNPDRLEVAVRNGKAFVGDTEVKKGRKATIEGGAPIVAKFDKKSGDSFDTWSKDRAKSLIALNRQLSRRGLSSLALMSTNDNVWVFDRFCGCYTFLPWGRGFSSPYGWGYSVYNPYWYTHQPWHNGGIGIVGGGSRPPAGSSGGSGGGGSNPPPRRSGGGSGGGYHPPPSAPHPSPSPPSRGDFGGGGGKYGSGPGRDAPAPVHNKPPHNN